MPNANLIVIVGHMTRDPEMRTTNKGTSVCNAGIAYNNPRERDKDKGTIFFGITLWGKTADSFCEMVKKGDCVMVTGQFGMNSWTSKDGEAKKQPHITASSWDFMGSPPARDTDAQHQQDYASQADTAAPY